MASVIEAILAVLTAISTWIVSTIGSLSSIFWVAETGLTFIGTLAVIGVGIAVVMLLISLIRRFLAFK